MTAPDYHQLPIPPFPKKLSCPADALAWSKWTIRQTARGVISPAQAKELHAGLKSFLDLSFQVEAYVASKPAAVIPPLTEEDQAALEERQARFAVIEAAADQEAEALALVPAEIEVVEEEPEQTMVIDIAGIIAAARAQTQGRLEKSPPRAVEEAPLTAQEQHPEANASAPRQPAYRPNKGPALDPDRERPLGQQLAEDPF